MAPSPQELVPSAEREVAQGADGERVVISGMSGVYPQSKHVQDLENILYNKVNPVTAEDCRWQYNHPEVRQHTGKAPSLDRFDAQFFKVHYRMGMNMDPMGRKVLEQAYQAIYDAGLSPEHLNGKKVGVYIGSCFSETEKSCFYSAGQKTGLGIAGCSKTMFANRISYWLNAKGPSMAIDAACCSSTAALEQGYLGIVRGECEAAIVGGANVCLHPQSSVHYGRIMTLCMDGKTKSFDQNADGLAKSEAVNVLFLQKAKNAIRIYAEVMHVKSEFLQILEGETGPQYGFYRDPINVAGFLKQFYQEANVSPQAVEYVEAFGSAVLEADKAELEAIAEVFCKDRPEPLLVGSVMSNIGYGEAASGISAITKVLLAYHNGNVAANLHCMTPRQDVAALRDGRMQVVTENQSFGRSYTAVNGISVTGINTHVLLHGRYKPKDLSRYKTSIPYLVNISARQDTAVEHILQNLKSRPIDPEEIALLHNIHGTRITGHMGRGYTIIDTNAENETVNLVEKANYYDDAKHSLWFVYSGMGSQWPGMGTQLMRIPIFAAAIERCRKVLEPKGIDIVNIITSTEKTTFNNILNSFVGIAAIQIGLTDILTAVGLIPDFIIGHSVGELGCGYADGCFTAEEMILSAYSRGLVSVQTPFIHGSMAAVGIGYEQVSKLVPPEIEISCHNGPDSSTISGPSDKMRDFVEHLTAQGIFAKEVPCSNIAYHSRYIAEAGPALLKYLSEVIKSPKPRSERWVSSSVPQDKWDQPAAKYSSAEYHTNNLLNPVLFEEASRLIPANAVVVEIAPHGLLQAILKRSLPESCRHIPLTRRGHADNAFLLDAIGKLYMEGYNPKIQTIYPQVEFPVSTGTPMLSHLVEWVHNERWPLPLFVSAHMKTAAACKFTISVHDDEHSYLQGNRIRGKVLFPFSAALVAVWDTLAMSLQVQRKQLSVEFLDVHLHAQPVLHEQRNLKLSVALHRGTGRFEIMDDNRKVATGFITGVTRDREKLFTREHKSNEDMDLNADDIYDELLYMRDYSYDNEFRAIHKANRSQTEAQIIWKDNWVTFIDGILQLHALRDFHDSVSQPYTIRRIYIDIKEHLTNKAIIMDGKSVMKAIVNNTQRITRCGGIIMANIQMHKLPALTDDAFALNSLKFIPRFSDVDEPNALQIYLQIVAENINKKSVNVLEITNNKEDLAVVNEIRNIFNDIPEIDVHYKKIERNKVLDKRAHCLNECDLVIVQDLSIDDSLCQMLYRILQPDTFLITQEEDNIRPSALYRVVSALNKNCTKLSLLKWRPTQTSPTSAVVSIRTHTNLDMLKTTRADLPRLKKLVILSSYPPVSGLVDLVKKWRKESDRNRIYLVMISDKDNLDQLPELDLAYNVLNDNVWGGEYYTKYLVSAGNGHGVTLRSSKIGDLNHLHWVEASEPIGSGVPITVHYVAINYVDAKRATGVIALKNKLTENSFGMDFSGITASGERVMGLLPHGAASARVVARPERLWPVPAHWSLEDAATVPSAYAHAFYCLGIKVRMLIGGGHRMLVHGGAGALGQAVISIALEVGYEVFTTVRDVRTKRFLMRLFPDLKEDHIGNSRDTSFCDMVQIATKGEGCNLIIITCAEGELKNLCLKSCSNLGIILDTVQIQNNEKFLFGMKHLYADKNYMPIDFTTIFNDKNIEEMKKIQTWMSEGIARGYVRPLSRVTYAAHEATRAFRLLAASAHRGRVILRLHGTTLLPQPRFLCSTETCHLILCEDSFGLQLAEMLISHGAKKIRLHWVNPPSYLGLKIRSWNNLGVIAEVYSENIYRHEGIIKLIKESNRLGSIEGIYVVATSISDKTVDKLTAAIEDLDLTTRKLCPVIKYFAVISAGNNIGEQTILSRERDGLPATSVKLSALRKAGEIENGNQESLSRRTALDGIEQALRLGQRAVCVHPRRVTPASLLVQIAAVAGIDIPDKSEHSLTLLDLGIKLATVPAICSFLRDVHNLSFAEEIIPTLSIHELRNIEETVKGSEFGEVRGLGTFFAYVDPDELLATTEMVFLPTLTNSSTMKDDEFDVTQTYLCIVPGLEGHHKRFSVLCERLKLPALVLQPGLDRLQETLRDTAERYAKCLMKKTGVNIHFYLLGYESGALVALEMASILEEYGLKGTVFCVGGTPEEFIATLEDQMSDFVTEQDLQDAVVRHMFTLILGSEESLDKVLQSASTWQEKVDICVRNLIGRMSHSAQYARLLIEAAYTRITKARLYEPNVYQLRSRLVLLHAASMSGPSSSSPAALLQRYSQQPVVVHELRLPLAHATQDLRCSAIVNRHLEDEILRAFEDKNLCDTYFGQKDTFFLCDDNFQ